jgi:hypothetical protein
MAMGLAPMAAATARVAVGWPSFRASSGRLPHHVCSSQNHVADSPTCTGGAIPAFSHWASRDNIAPDPLLSQEEACWNAVLGCESNTRRDIKIKETVNLGAGAVGLDAVRLLPNFLVAYTCG